MPRIFDTTSSSRQRLCLCRLLALFGHALISELSLLSGAKRKLDLETPKGRYWREADIGVSAHVG
jgi:hypothetical protein